MKQRNREHPQRLYVRENVYAPAGDGGEDPWREVTCWVDGITTVHSERHANDHYDDANT